MDPIIGEIKLFAYPYAPKGWMICEGQLLPIAEWQVLFSLIGVKFGGDGKTNFALPDLRDKTPAPGMGYCMAVMGIYPQRK